MSFQAVSRNDEEESSDLSSGHEISEKTQPLSFYISKHWKAITFIIVILLLNLIAWCIIITTKQLAIDKDHPSDGPDNNSVSTPKICSNYPTWISTEPDVPESFTLRALCDQTFWQPNIYLNCTNVAGGTFNVLNSVVTCLRWAIDGGMGMLLPKFATRAKDNPSRWYDTWEDYSYLFDRVHLLKSMQEKCPQFIIKEADFVIDTVVENKFFVKWQPKTTGMYRSHSYDLLHFNTSIDLPSNKSIAIVEDNPLWGWDFVKERKKIHQSLLNAVKFSPELLAIASTIIEKLPQGKFIGFHLRAEKDFVWYNYETITAWFNKHFSARDSDVSTIYVATGTRDVEERFRQEMQKDPKIRVISKWSLAEGNDEIIAKMKDLRFDQLSVVDFEVLSQSDYFYGVGQSSFAWAVGVQRGNGSIEDCGCNLYECPDPYFVCCY